MTNKDDDLIKQQGEDFDPAAEDEFSIPDEPLSESDHEDDDLDLGLSTEDDAEQDDELSLDLSGDEHQQDDAQEYEAESEEFEEAEEYDTDAPQQEFKLGLKSYIGIALAGVITAGGLGYYVMGAMGGGNNGPTPEQAREIIRQKAQEGIAQTQQSQLPAQQPAQQQPMQQGGNSAPVNVQSFPNGNGGGAPTVPPAQTGGNGGGNSSDGAALASLQGAESEQEPRDKPTYTERLQLTNMTAFQALSDLADRNREDIDELQDGHKSQGGDVSDLEERVSALEAKLDKLIEKGALKTAAASKAESGPEQTTAKTRPAASKGKESGPVEYEPVAPKTPEQIKALQRQLAMYGYRPGKVDGILGQNTREAVQRLQREHGLPANGWLTQDTLDALSNPKHYSGTYPPKAKTKFADHPRDEEKHEVKWYVRGLTHEKAIVYRLDGVSYLVTVGTEIPGMGQVEKFDPANNQVVTAKGIIGKRKAG
ncbi:MAG: putative transglycosylase protein [Marinobacter sp. T13-3]|nr:MAG: putative transglycosylase protein [Marinobacter sp. T13-3]